MLQYYIAISDNSSLGNFGCTNNNYKVREEEEIDDLEWLEVVDRVSLQCFSAYAVIATDCVSSFLLTAASASATAFSASAFFASNFANFSSTAPLVLLNFTLRC